MLPRLPYDAAAVELEHVEARRAMLPPTLFRSWNKVWMPSCPSPGRGLAVEAKDQEVSRTHVMPGCEERREKLKAALRTIGVIARAE